MNGIADQYRIIAEGVGWAGRASRGRLRFDGADARSFLQALVTNDVLSLQPGQGRYAAWLTPQGRMRAELRVHHRGDHLLVEVPVLQAASLAGQFDQLVFTEDVRVTDVSATTGQLLVLGSRAAETAASLLGITNAAAMLEGAAPLTHWSSAELTAARSDDLDVPAFDIFYLTSSTRPAALEWLASEGVPRVSDDLVDALRIQAGHPVFGIDMTEDTIPLEAGLLERGISTSKGCYVGQEIVIRILHRGGGRVAKRLVTLQFGQDASAPPRTGARLLHDGRDVGVITSAAWSPVTGAPIALGYVHRDQAEAGATLATDDPSAPHAAISGFAH